MATKHPCAGRSKAQIEAFEAIAISQEPAGYSPRTIGALMKAGLIEQAGVRKIPFSGAIMMEIPVYQVPTHHHIQWCEWCDENISDEELDAFDGDK